jgi:hypothetical protein
MKGQRMDRMRAKVMGGRKDQRKKKSKGWWAEREGSHKT